MSDDPYAPTLPRAVREQVERAHQIAREAGVANVPPPDESHSAPTGAQSAEVSDGQPPQQEAQPEPQPQPQPDPQQQFDQQPQEQPPQPSQPDWEARYNTLQGKYNAEMAELRGQMRAMQDMLARQSQPPAPSAEGAREVHGNVPPPGRREIPQTDIEAYGAELVEATQRWAEARMAPYLQDYDRRLLTIEGNTRQQAQMSAADRVHSALDAAMPDWRNVNVAPEFHAWLAQVDPFTGQTRQRLLGEAYNAGDAPRTLAFFRAYVNEQTAVTPSPQRIQPGQTGGGAMPAASAATLPLEMLAVPGRGQTAMPPAPGAGNGKRTWTGAEITAFSTDRALGRWRGREAEADALAQDIHAAQFEGRIR